MGIPRGILPGIPWALGGPSDLGGHLGDHLFPFPGITPGRQLGNRAGHRGGMGFVNL